MAKEESSKAILKARTMTEDIRLALSNVKAEQEDVQIALRRSRGLAAALKRQLFRLDTVVQMVDQGQTPAQVTIDETLQGAYVEIPGLRDDEREAIKRAAERGRDDDGEEPEEEEETPEKPGAAAVENLNSFFAPPAILAEKLAAAGRPLPASFLETWSAEDRAAALKWCDNNRLPLPECLGKIFLEDLDLTTILHRVQLMIWIGFESPATLESVRQSLDIPEYAMTEWGWETVGPWAVAVHRRDRGERGIEMPELPALTIPPAEVFVWIKQSLAEEGEASLSDLFEDRGMKDDLFTHLAVQTLLQAGEIVTGDDGKLHAARPDLVESADKLLERAYLIATRGGSSKPTAGETTSKPEEGTGEPMDTGTPEELGALPSYELAYILDPRTEDPEGDGYERVVIRFAGQEKTAESITGVSIRTADQGPAVVRNNAELAYLDDPEVLRRTRESWQDILDTNEGVAALETMP